MQQARLSCNEKNQSTVTNSPLYQVLLHSQIERTREAMKQQAQSFFAIPKPLMYFCTPLQKTAHRNRRREAQKFKVSALQIWKVRKNYYLCTPKQNGTCEELEIAN